MTTNLKSVSVECVWLPPVFFNTLGADIRVDATSYDKNSKTVKYVAKRSDASVEGFVSIERLPAFFRADARYDVIVSTGLNGKDATSGKHSHIAFLDKSGSGITNWVEDHIHFVLGQNVSPFVKDKHTHELLPNLSNDDYLAVPEDQRVFEDVTNNITTNEDPILSNMPSEATVARAGGEITSPQLDTRPFTDTLAEALRRGLTAGNVLKENGAKDIKIATKISHQTGLLDTTITYTPKEEI